MDKRVWRAVWGEGGCMTVARRSPPRRSQLIEKSSCRLQRAGTRRAPNTRSFAQVSRARDRVQYQHGKARVFAGPATTRGRSRSMVQPHARAAAAEKPRHRRGCGLGRMGTTTSFAIYYTRYTRYTRRNVNEMCKVTHAHTEPSCSSRGAGPDRR